MRIGAIWEPTPNAYYRAIDPLNAMERRGHEVVWPKDKADPGRSILGLTHCDVVHVYRHPNAWATLAKLIKGGLRITFDNDDDHTSTPKESPNYKEARGLSGQLYFNMTAKVARMAQWCTTTNEHLAEKYRRKGVERVEVIDNYLDPEMPRRRNRHRGIVIGWIAAGEHEADARQLRLAEALEPLLAKHEDVHVECIGVDLKLPVRYRHDPGVPFGQLPGRMGGWDIGIAPLADIPWNWSRSDIKVKEYAASCLPWLASPIGPYVGLGEQEGGRLVPGDGWFDALDELVTQRRLRKRLGRNAEKWAKTQTIDAVADRWEQLFLEAAGGA